MDVKTESKLLLSALLLLPFTAGLVMIIGGAYGIFGPVILLIGLAGLLWLWIPRKWFRKEDKQKTEHKHEHKHH